jgi:catechol 2,3-dioxygenase-like lactoylglutathione lyase family enzyme
MKGDMMNTPDRPYFQGGANIAIKVPEYKFEDTVRFYGEILGLEQLEGTEASVCFRFGPNKLWIDRMHNYSRSDVWLEMLTDDVERARDYLNHRKGPRQDEIKNLPGDLDGFWISDPAGTIHLVEKPDCPRSGGTST